MLELPGVIEKPFEIFRGDSFQSVVIQSGKALLISILIRAKLRSLVQSQLNQFSGGEFKENGKQLSIFLSVLW